LILLISLIGSAVTVRDYQNDVAANQVNSDIATHVQDTRSDAGNAALLLMRLAISGDLTLIPEIRESTQAAVDGITLAAQMEAANPNGTQAITLAQIALAAQPLAESVEEVIALRQSGDAAGAMAKVDEIAPNFRQFRIILGDVARVELEDLASRSAEADAEGDRALALLIVSGVSGLVVALGAAYYIAQSIISPLASLEATARTIGEGDLDARATPAGPRELRRLANTLNDMALRLQQREADLVLFNTELRERNRQLLEARTQAATDGLTSLGNHRTFQDAIRRLVPNNDGSPVSLIMLDIDSFKAVNDSLGHQVGDEILRACARIFVASANGHHVYRYGGDEFAVVAPGMALDEAEILADQLRTGVLTNHGVASRHVTISLGVASYPDTAGSAEELIYEADAAMYAAKLSGKNMTCRWDRMPTSPLRAAAAPTAPVR
jgi:diguanylate cyclase (GGDEF)-like protein